MGEEEGWLTLTSLEWVPVWLLWTAAGAEEGRQQRLRLPTQGRADDGIGRLLTYGTTSPVKCAKQSGEFIWC